MADFALQSDGTQNYINLGTMGNFGSNLGSGLYCKFYFKSTSSTDGTIIGTGSIGSQFFKIGANTGGSGRLRVILVDNSGNKVDGYSNVGSALYNGTSHLVEITVTPSTNTINMKIDGISQTLIYVTQTTPSSFVNFPKLVSIAARSNGFSTMVEWYSCTIDDVYLGTSSSTLYGLYLMDEGSGITTADTSGNGNTGTLTGSPVPSWVSGLAPAISNVNNRMMMGVGS